MHSTKSRQRDRIDCYRTGSKASLERLTDHGTGIALMYCHMYLIVLHDEVQFPEGCRGLALAYPFLEAWFRPWGESKVKQLFSVGRPLPSCIRFAAPDDWSPSGHGQLERDNKMMTIQQRILIADDGETFRESTSAILADAGPRTKAPPGDAVEAERLWRTALISCWPMYVCLEMPS